MLLGMMLRVLTIRHISTSLPSFKSYGGIKKQIYFCKKGDNIKIFKLLFFLKKVKLNNYL